VRLGIDLGTTRTVVAYADRGNYPIVDFVDDAGDSRGFIPSLVAERDGELRFGFDALAASNDPSFNVLRSFKRLLSGADASPTQTVTLGGTEIELADLLTRFLSHVREALRSRSTLRKKVTHARELSVAVGVPANAFATQRLVTLEAFRRSGFVVRAMINEPSAAGFEYTHRHANTLTSRRDAVVVYDLGGGTFDASLVRVAGHHHEVLATVGINRLGGDDFDAVLSQLALESAGLPAIELPARVAERWLEQCRLAKEALTPSSRKVTLDLEAALGKRAPRPEVSLPVSTYYDACVPLIEQTLGAMAPLMGRAEKEVPEATGLEDIAGVYVVGGASELPVVGRALRERFGRRVHRSPYPSAAIAIGLAIACDDAGAFQLIDRTARTFAVFREGNAGREVVLDPIFERDAVLPVAGEPVERTRSYYAAHNVGHYRFFECGDVDPTGKPRGDMALCGDALFPFDSALVGERDLASVPVERLEVQGARIVEHYALDHNGIVHVRIRNADSGYERAYDIGDTGAGRTS
jgi:molecular chaperone DnaK (HSP70)